MKINRLIIKPNIYLATYNNSYIYIKNIDKDGVWYYWTVYKDFIYCRSLDRFLDYDKWSEAPFRNVTDKEINELIIKDIIE